MANFLSESIRCIGVLSAFLITGVFSASTQASTDDPGFWSFQIENDAIVGSEDRWYTGGYQTGYSSTKSPPEYLEKISDLCPFLFEKRFGSLRLQPGPESFHPGK